MDKALVLSDPHGNPQLMKNAILHAKETGRIDDSDRIIIAGDLVDIGEDWKGCLDYSKEIRAEVLWGNHDLCAIFDIRIWPQDPNVGKVYLSELANEQGWKLAAAHNGVLITHGGLSVSFAKLSKIDSGETAEDIASRLNDLSSNREDLRVVTNMANGPLWFRPLEGDMPFRIKQVVGHTPIEFYSANEIHILTLADVTFIDPFVRKTFDKEGHAVYAVIDEEGNVERVNVLEEAP